LLQPVVGVDLVLELGRDILIVVEGVGRFFTWSSSAETIRVLSSSRTSTICHGIRVERVPNKPIFTPMYSGWSFSSTKRSSTLPILSPSGS
jgi:hypothetical protein